MRKLNFLLAASVLAALAVGFIATPAADAG